MTRGAAGSAAPAPTSARWRRRARAVRWPAGMGIAAWRWLRRSRRVPRRRLRLGVFSDVERFPRRDGARVQGAPEGVGPTFQRRYIVRISGSPLTAEQLAERLGEDLNAASPVEIAVFDKTSGADRGLKIGDEYTVHMPGPWNCPVRVVERTAVSFRFVTLRGHLEAGEIEFRVGEARDGDLVFMIESWARSGDRWAEFLYAKMGIAKEMQLHMWTHFCSRVAEISGGQMVGDVEVQTERKDLPGRRRRPVARTVDAAFRRGFVLAARLRDRPLHPRGLVFDATLRLHGTSQRWGAPFLDARADLRGKARLSRAVGLPPVLPDVLGLALRWPQHGSGAGPDTGEPADDQATAELLLATTGRTRLGRHLLRPMTRWSPAFYGSLLAYRVGDRRVLLGAVARRERARPAGLATLARSVAERPLLFDLVVATDFGPWERFGELRLTGPARSDEREPMRFDPARHPIQELHPAGLFQQVRGSTYAAVQRFARHRANPCLDSPSPVGRALLMTRSTRTRERMRRLHSDLHRRPLNFDPGRHDMDRPESGWHVDDYRQQLPPEPPGPPIPGGSWEVARRLIRNYQYADPAIIREICRSGPPEPGRDMLLEARFYGLRFYLGLRVGDVIDTTVEENGRQARVWGWNYQTLEGHLERGQMSQEVRKWLDTGEVEFHIHVFSQAAASPHPIVRFGFFLFGRYMQLKFYKRACRRMKTLTAATLTSHRGTIPGPARHGA
ncbi:DUF1990 family protein [Actinomadura sp. KC216]|uniref:DUF1990 family protein n=1 Tax=Actinomadura sp. KC216 TaxID=2530370 RepID=UPI00104A9400|nr:DUF1990 family protein [Actinomadura sp. KC216]TDB88742.1 DUF1990 family protein [Actinomadura sp. KC216]